MNDNYKAISLGALCLIAILLTTASGVWAVLLVLGAIGVCGWAFWQHERSNHDA